MDTITIGLLKVKTKNNLNEKRYVIKEIHQLQ